MRKVNFVRWTLAFTLTLLGAAHANAASGLPPLTWRWSNPKPHGNNIAGMAVGKGWIIHAGERGQLYLSRDLEEWIPRETQTTNDLRSVTFFDGRIIVTGEQGTILVGDANSPRPQFQKIDLSSPDWLEGVAASASMLVAVGDNGAIYTSNNGTTWQRQPQGFSDWLRGVAFGSGVFVAVGENGFVATSVQGTTWQRQTSGVPEHLNQVAWVQNRFIAVGENGRAIASGDGRSWQRIATGATNALYAITASTNNLAVAGDGELRLQDGSGAWSDEIRATNRSFPAPGWTYLSSIWDGTLFLMGGRSGLMVEGFKTNSTSATVWVDRFGALRNWIWDLARTPDYYIAVGDRASVMTSEDGIDWNLELVPDSLTNAIFLGVGATTNLTLVVGNQGKAMLSSNGVIWNPVQMPSQNDLQGVATLNNFWVVSGGSGTILTSANGTNWTAQTSPTTAFLSSVAAAADRFIAVGNMGTILQSSDGRTWSLRPSGTTNWIYRVRYLGGQFVAVGQNGTILASSDGANWVSRSSGTSQWLNDVARVGPTYFAAGNQGTVLRSSDLVQWENIGTITRKSLFALASSDGQLVAAGVEGVILRSRVIPDLSPIAIKDFTHKSGQNAFLFWGKPDQKFSLDHSASLPAWTTGVDLEFLDSTGSLIYFENSDPAFDPQFFRTTLR